MRPRFYQIELELARVATRAGWLYAARTVLCVVVVGVVAAGSGVCEAQSSRTLPVEAVEAPRPDRPDRPERPTADSPRASADMTEGFGAGTDRIRALAERASKSMGSSGSSGAAGAMDEEGRVGEQVMGELTGGQAGRQATEADQLEGSRTPLLGGASGSVRSADQGGDAGGAGAGGVVDSSNWVLDTLAALGVVVGVVLMTRWAMSRLSGRVSVSGGRSPVEVLSRTAVAPRNHVILLKIGQRIVVANDSPTGMRTLTEIVDPEEVAMLLAETAAGAASGAQGGFRQLLGKLNRDYDAADRLETEGGDDSEHFVDRARDRLSALRSRVRAARISEEA